MCSFCRNFTKLCGVPGFGEYVLNVFSCFYIEIAYSNFTFCGAYMLSFLARHTIRQNEHTPDVYCTVDGQLVIDVKDRERWIVTNTLLF